MKAFKSLTLSLGVAALCLCYASCVDNDTDDSIYIGSISGSINGHDYVDLGLSVKWATCNVGADSPNAYGDYFAWGETTTKSNYTRSSSVTYGMSMSDISGNATYDAARANWGGTWRMPTKDEMDELVDKCTTEWITVNGVGGRKVTGLNGNNIFLPAAGIRFDRSLNYGGAYGYYWSSSSRGNDTICAYGFDVSPDGFYKSMFNRYFGASVRPVSD